MRQTGETKLRVCMATYCLQRLRAICALYLHTVHSSRRTTFFVVLASVLLTHPGVNKELKNGFFSKRTPVEDGFGLTTVSGLLPVVTAFTLGKGGGLASLVLGDLVGRVLAALLALAAERRNPKRTRSTHVSYIGGMMAHQ
jgi:hypothetical protein